MNRRHRYQPFPHDWPTRLFLSFPATLPDRESYIRRGPEIRTKQISIPQSLNWRIVVELGLTALLESFLTRSLHDDIGLMTFVCHAQHHIMRLQEVIFRELVIEFFSTVRFNRDVRVWSDDSAQSFKLGGLPDLAVCQSCGSDWRYTLPWILIILYWSPTQTVVFSRNRENTII